MSSEDQSGNPRARALSEQYGFPSGQIAVWLETGYTPGEVERACQLGREMQAEPGDILAMLDAGLDWREIRKALRVMPDPEQDEDGDAGYGIPSRSAPRRRRPRRR